MYPYRSALHRKPVGGISDPDATWDNHNSL
jgi:hypothetical protein